MELQVKLLTDTATVPTVEHPGEDLAWDLYASEEVNIRPGQLAKVSTGIAAQLVSDTQKFGLLVRDRSGLASKMLFVTGGVIDASYTGEIKVMVTNNGPNTHTFIKGDKIAQIIPIPVLTDSPVKIVEELANNTRGDKGFGSSGR